MRIWSSFSSHGCLLFGARTAKAARMEAYLLKNMALRTGSDTGGHIGFHRALRLRHFSTCQGAGGVRWTPPVNTDREACEPAAKDNAPLYKGQAWADAALEGPLPPPADCTLDASRATLLSAPDVFGEAGPRPVRVPLMFPGQFLVLAAMKSSLQRGHRGELKSSLVKFWIQIQRGWRDARILRHEARVQRGGLSDAFL